MGTPRNLSGASPYLVCDCVKAQELCPHFIPRKGQVANFLIKPLHGPTFMKCHEVVGMTRLVLRDGCPTLSQAFSTARKRHCGEADTHNDEVDPIFDTHACKGSKHGSGGMFLAV